MNHVPAKGHLLISLYKAFGQNNFFFSDIKKNGINNIHFGTLRAWCYSSHLLKLNQEKVRYEHAVKKGDKEHILRSYTIRNKYKLSDIAVEYCERRLI